MKPLFRFDGRLVDVDEFLDMQEHYGTPEGMDNELEQILNNKGFYE